MNVHFTKEFSVDISNKFRFVSDAVKPLEQFFHDRFYGEDLTTLIIGLCSMSPKFAPFFKPRKPDYRKESKTYMHRGIEVTSDPKMFSYEVRLAFDKYVDIENIEHHLAEEILASLDVISTIKAIKNFDLNSFKHDFHSFFKQIGWL
jgi:hypothetical protein